jgi:hypothetical protein
MATDLITQSEQPQTALAPKLDAVDVVSRIVEMAADPSMDVSKLEKLIDMQERVMKIQAVAAFNAAFSDMQGDLPTITERGEILVNGQLRSKYAKYEDIIEVVRPIMKQYGFALRHRNEAGATGIQVIIGILSHKGGHSEEDRFECPPDTSGGKQPIQAVGSTRSYGQRYTTISLLNIVTKGQDNDGQATPKQVKDPEGFEDWLTDLSAAADTGKATMTEAWEKARPEFREHATKHYKGKLAHIRSKVTGGQR